MLGFSTTFFIKHRLGILGSRKSHLWWESINAVLPLQLNAKVVIFALLSHVFRTLKCIVLSVVQEGGEPFAHKREHVPHLAQCCLAVVVKHLFTIQDRGTSRILVGLLFCSPSLE